MKGTGVNVPFVKLKLPCTLRHEPLQQEGEEVGESVELTIESDIAIC